MAEPIRTRPEWLAGIRELVAQAPPFSAEQRDKLAILLRPCSSQTTEPAPDRESHAS